MARSVIGQARWDHNPLEKLGGIIATASDLNCRCREQGAAREPGRDCKKPTNCACKISSTLTCRKA